MRVLLMTCGFVLTPIGVRSGYRSSRAAIVSLAGDGKPTRAAVAASRPFLACAGMRRFVRPVAAAMPWPGIAMYDRLMVSLGAAAT